MEVIVRSASSTATGECACSHMFCDDHGGICPRCGFSGCGLCLASCCVFDTYFSLTLLEALNLALPSEMMKKSSKAESMKTCNNSSTSHHEMLTEFSVDFLRKKLSA